MGEGAERQGGTFSEIERLAVSIDVLELLTGDIVLPELSVTRPSFRLIRDASGRANWEADPDGEDVAPRLPPIRHFVIEGGKLDLVDATKEARAQRKLFLARD